MPPRLRNGVRNVTIGLLSLMSAAPEATDALLDGLLTLGQAGWPWAQGRITAGFVLDLRALPEVGRYVMFFHGSTKAGLEQHGAHGHASLGIAWSGDLVEWTWPGKDMLE